MESALRGPVPHDLKVIETLGWWPGEGPRRLDAHLARAELSCITFGFAFDRGAVAAEIAEINSETPLRLRLTWGADGFEVTQSPMGPAADLWRLALHETRLKSDDPWLRVKTTQRGLYDQARARLPEGIDEYLFLNELGQVCEGTITNLFVEDGAHLVTPPLAVGVLPGILRAELIASGQAVEGPILPEMVRDGRKVFVGNALRGLIPAQLIA